jgi:hypothetical protein
MQQDDEREGIDAASCCCFDTHPATARAPSIAVVLGRCLAASQDTHVGVRAAARHVTDTLHNNMHSSANKVSLHVQPCRSPSSPGHEASPSKLIPCIPTEATPSKHDASLR